MKLSATHTAHSTHQFCTILVGLVRERMRSRNGVAPLIIALDGRSGSGKTTLTEAVRQALVQEGISPDIFRLDDTYQGWTGLSPAITQWRGNSTALKQGKAVQWNGWDWSSSQPTGPFTLTIEASVAPRVLVVEGVGALAGSADIRCWIEQDTTSRKRDALQRDGDTYRPFWDLWAEQEEQLFAHYRKCYQKCDILYER